MAEKLLSIREAAQFLDISEKELLELVEAGVIPGYKIANTYLRFRQEQLQEIHPRIKKFLKLSHQKTKSPDSGYSLWERVADFFYYNDFYIVTLAVIIVILFLIFK